MKATRALLFLIALAVAGPAGAQVVPDSTRYMTDAPASIHATVYVSAAPDSFVYWFGFEARSVLVTPRSGDVYVVPLVRTGDEISDPGEGSQGRARIYENPRKGDPRYYYEPDTLSAVTAAPGFYCCDAILGLKIKGLGASGSVLVEASTSILGGRGGGGGGGGAAVLTDIWSHMVDLDEHPDTALAVDQLVYPEDLGITEALLGTVGVTLTSGTWTTTSAFDTREAVVEGLYLSWGANFSDSVQVVQRGGPTTDVAAHAGMNLNPNGNSPTDSTVTYFVDTGGTGGSLFIPLVDRTGSYRWSPYKSWGFLKIGTGNVTTFKAYYVWRRMR